MGKSIDLPKLKIQYKDYAYWTNYEKQNDTENYWLEKFSGEIPVLNLPSYKKRPDILTFNGDLLFFNYPYQTLQSLSEFSKKNDVTLFMTLLSCIKALFYRYSSNEDIIIGTVSAGREHPDLENQMGLFLNTLAIRTIFSGEDNFQELLEKVKENLLNAYQNQSYPFDELIEKIQSKRNRSRSALFDVSVTLQNQEQLNTLNDKNSLTNLKIEDYKIETITSKNDIEITFTENHFGLSMGIIYNTDIYDKFFIENIFEHLEKIFNIIIDNPKTKLNSIDYINKEEKNRILIDFNNSKIEYPNDKTIVDLFENQVQKTPDNFAIVYEDISLSYIDLNNISNQLGQFLREYYSVKPNDLISIKLDRSEKFIICILGVLKSGGAYIPIDNDYPNERINYIIEDSKSKVVIDDVFFDNFLLVKDNYNIENLKRVNTVEDISYCIYTSGSTGNPKGCCISHANLLNYIIWANDYYFESQDLGNWSLITSIAFDLSITAIFSSITRGKKLCIGNSNKDIPTLLREAFSNNELDTIKLTPSHISLLKELNIKETNIKKIICGGEQLLNYQIEIINKLDKSIEIYNEYGPTETTVGCIVKKIENAIDPILIGKPISNTEIYILNESNLLCGFGEFGEINIGGAGVSIGYLNKPELTNESFIENPLKKGEKLYKTGDLGRWLPDGNIEYLGRIDNQVKINGYRIELAEIEKMLSNFSEKINQIAVLVKLIKGEKTIVAYYEASDKIEKSEIFDFLASKLPKYMIPSYFVQLDQIPLTPNGKVDRKALPDEISDGHNSKGEYIAPSNQTELELVKVIASIIGLDEKTIGINESFFDLGGNSIKGIKVINEVQAVFNVKLDIGFLFKKPIIKDLSDEIILQKLKNEDISDNEVFDKITI